MKKKTEQLDMMKEVDRFTIERERREKEEMIRRLDEKYTRLDQRAADKAELPAGLVVIIGQDVFRNGRYTMHFYRAVLGYHTACNGAIIPHLVEQQTEEWPDVPPWAYVAGRENEARDNDIHSPNLYWNTGEVGEPVITWWQKKWGD